MYSACAYRLTCAACNACNACNAAYHTQSTYLTQSAYLTQVCAHSELMLGVVRDECRGLYWLWLGFATVDHPASSNPYPPASSNPQPPASSNP